MDKQLLGAAIHYAIANEISCPRDFNPEKWVDFARLMLDYAQANPTTPAATMLLEAAAAAAGVRP